MSEKRKDNRGRVLHNGEIQRKDGRYQFKYIDADGKEKFVYSWRLDHNDATPPGKVRSLSLREMERKIQADGKSYSSIHSLRGVLRPAFKMAVDDDLIRKSPFDFELASVIVNDSHTRLSITRDEER